MSKIKLFKILFCLSFINSFNGYTQNTIGVLTNTQDSFNGYTLFTSQKETYLINNCGEVINQWSSDFVPGNSVYLLENGNLLRACKIENLDVDLPGAGGRVELYNWEGTLLWGYNYSTSQVRQHHDIYPMPNGNVLILAATVMTNSEAVQAGRNPANLPQSRLFNEQIIEIEPTGTTTANIVWEWNIKDHLIQDFDNTKDNFGIIEDHPELLDINYLGGSEGNSNWLHINSMQYDETLNQIVLSSRLLDEIYIIDHSTTTVEAASHSGGTYGKGGDLLYRWGNPQAYGQGIPTDHQIYGQHYPHYIPSGSPNAGKLIVFNNGNGRIPEFSEVFILTPPTIAPGEYSYTANTAYGPTNPDYIYKDPIDETNFYSFFLSGAQELPNGNILICSGANGYFFEIDENNNKVWEYVSPISAGNILTQGVDPVPVNSVFRAIRYASDYEGFSGRDLTPGLPIELMPDLSNCTVLSVEENELSSIKIYPNPTKDIINIKSKTLIDKIEIYNVLGGLVLNKYNSKNVDLRNIPSGLYMLKIHVSNTILSKKIMKQ